jgi:hypothetical protein
MNGAVAYTKGNDDESKDKSDHLIAAGGSLSFKCYERCTEEDNKRLTLCAREQKRPQSETVGGRFVGPAVGVVFV